MKITNRLTSVITVFLIMMGIAIHDTRLDKHTLFAATIPVVAVHEGLQLVGEPSAVHLHVERVLIGDIVGGHSTTNPFIAARHHEDKQYRSQRHVNGHHPFDDYLLPLVS